MKQERTMDPCSLDVLCHLTYLSGQCQWASIDSNVSILLFLYHQHRVTCASKSPLPFLDLFYLNRAVAKQHEDELAASTQCQIACSTSCRVPVAQNTRVLCPIHHLCDLDVEPLAHLHPRRFQSRRAVRVNVDESAHRVCRPVRHELGGNQADATLDPPGKEGTYEAIELLGTVELGNLVGSCLFVSCTFAFTICLFSFVDFIYLFFLWNSMCASRSEHVDDDSGGHVLSTHSGRSGSLLGRADRMPGSCLHMNNRHCHFGGVESSW